MKNVFYLLSTGILAIASLSASAQSSTLPASTPVSATVPWSLPSNCTATTTCQFQVYRCQGNSTTCTTTSNNWTLITTTAAQVTSYKDSSVAGATQYSYDVEAVPTGSSTVFSGPSNVGQVTTLFTPTAPVLGTVTTP